MDEVQSAVWCSENVKWNIRLRDVKISPGVQKKASGNSDEVRRTPQFLYKTLDYMNSGFYLKDCIFKYVTLDDIL